MRGAFQVLALALCLLCAGGASASVYLSVDDTSLSREAFDALYQQASQLRKMDSKTFADELVDALLMYRWAQGELPEEQWRGTEIGYAYGWHIRRQLDRTLAKLYPKWPASELMRQYSKPGVQAQEALTSIAAQSILGYQLTPAQRDRAASLVLARMAFPDQQDVTLTLLEVYEGQSIQGKKALMEGDVKLLSMEMLSWKQHQLRLWWLSHEGGVKKDAIDDLRRTIEAHYFYPKILNALGVIKRNHGDNPGLIKFREQVSAAQIKSYYQRHQEDFRFLAKVKVRGVIYGDETAARLARQQIVKGASWTDLKAPSHPANLPLDAEGWLHKDAVKPTDWLASLAFATPPGDVSEVIRSPAGDWVILQVSGRKYDYYPADSETVRYLATDVLAIQQAVAAYSELINHLRRQASLQSKV
ncbi:peptidyl-prolyl cis-trans isomerase [Hahella sp. KA22]|uniref:peptidylprolyl isomerase n=1 Tax=Hahella sp. KA22 TaxID=1628392 RepID=UPI000FDDC242|nr:peptidylprolyl isomerase [Hahella sp. KA22]AZZ95174.1 peptidyl-prolyl cis-trans isomerase [Hahella sp. KA22]QAY52819.1 peptidyl-prolyl cis-trans isomerase [Hahella sp. KA22]